MKGRNKQGEKLTFAQIEADLLMADHAIEDSTNASIKLSKYLRGQAGYHLQQAAEKLIKMQMYQSGCKLDNAKLYKHSISELIVYANSLGIKLVVPDYIKRNDERITNWEAEGRYDVHVVVRTDTLKKTYDVIRKWADDLQR